MQLRGALLALLAVGCTNQTGIELAVSAPGSPTSIQAGVASVEFLVSHQSYCERWVLDQGLGTGTRAGVLGRDLHTQPYELLIKPTHFTDLNDPVNAVAIALDAAGKPIGFAEFGAHPFELGHVNEYTAELALFARTDATYVHPEGCICIPGQAWMGNGSGTGCDLDVVPSFDRFQDTAGCELSQGRRELTGPVCDGHQYPGEVTDRRLPCFNAGGGACAVGLRNCADHDGFAYDDECVPAAGDPATPTGALCDAYAACEKTACGDLIGCFLATAQMHAVNCTLHVDPVQLKPCSDGKWETVLPMTGTLTGTQCTASMVEGRIQPPLTVGLKDPAAATGTRTRSTLCPPTLVVESIAADPALKQDVTVLTTVGDAVIKVNLKIVRSCEQVTSSLTCG